MRRASRNVPAKIPIAGMPSSGIACRSALRAWGTLPAVASRQRLHPWAEEIVGKVKAVASNAKKRSFDRII
jgi:hypothetical protein